MAPADAAPFRGVAVALVTLFDEDGGLDAGGTADLAAQLVEAGVHAVLVAGSTGEAWALTAGERTALIDAVRDAVDVPIIAGTGAPTAAAAAAFTAAAADHGADCVLALSPPGVEDPRPYYDEVAKAAAGVPVLAYHFPVVSAPGLPVSVLGDLPVVGCKDSSGDRQRLADALATYDGHYYTGATTLLSTAGRSGLPGVIEVLANSHPEQVLAAVGGDEEAQAVLDPLFDDVLADFPAAVKRMTAARFGTSTAVRPR